MEHELSAFYRISRADRDAVRIAAFAVNVVAFDDAERTAEDYFITWDAFEDALPFLTEPAIYAVGG